MKYRLPQQDYGTCERNVQLKIDESFAEKVMPANDSVRLLDKIVEEMDIGALMRAYSAYGRKPATPPQTMLKIVLYAGMEHVYSSRKIQSCCERDINYIWLLDGAAAPSHFESARFRSKRLAECAEELFGQLVKRLHEMGEIQYEHLFVDGTKIEANANKYSFVWKKSTNKYEARLDAKAAKLVPELCGKYCVEANNQSELLRQLENKVDFPFVHGRGKRKRELQRDIEQLRSMVERKQKYTRYNETFRGRNSFSKTDPDATITREQLATMLYRYHGSPAVTAGEDFADQANISVWAVDGVRWARGNGIVNGVGNNRFDPQGNANRAQLATVVRNYMTTIGASTPEPTPEVTPAPEPADGKVLVAYFSATGSTENVAGYIVDKLGADRFELVPTDPYTSADLDWTTSGSRVNQEHDDESRRDIALVRSTPDNWDDYDVVFVGYPIWWGIAAWPVNHFVTDNDFTGKTVIPFCTSASSGLGQSGDLLKEMAGTGDWLEGHRFSSGASRSTVEQWVDTLELPANAPAQEGKTLIAYFSMPDNVDDSTVTVNGEVLGNNQYFAQVIQEVTGGDVFRIEPQTPYPADHSALVDQASAEQANDARPAIKGTIENFEDYDTVFIGYPIWWSDMPMILYTFFDTYDFSGKTIIPFGTHGGSGWAGTPSTIAELEPNATMLGGLSISRDHIQDARQDIVNWISELDT